MARSASRDRRDHARGIRAGFEQNGGDAAGVLARERSIESRLRGFADIADGRVAHDADHDRGCGAWQPISTCSPIGDVSGHRRFARLSVMIMVDDSRGRSIDVKSRPAIIPMPIVWKYPGSIALVDTCSCGPPDNDTQSVPGGHQRQRDVCDALSNAGQCSQAVERLCVELAAESRVSMPRESRCTHRAAR